MPRSAKINEVSEERLKIKKRSLEREPRTISLSHEGWKLYQLVAKKRHVGLGDMLEVITAELAERYLTPEEREEARREAEAILAERQQEIAAIEQALRK